MAKKNQLKHNVFDYKGKVVSHLELNKSLFDGRVNMPLLYQVIDCYRTNRKSQRLASTKTRAYVRGSGAKPWRQKGTGRARVGERRNPLWRKGGVVFGPHPRRVYKKIPKKMGRLALQSALNAKQNDDEIRIIDSFPADTVQTKNIARMLDVLQLDKRAVLVDERLARNFTLASRNVARIHLVRAADLNAYSALDCKYLILTKGALAILESRLLVKQNGKNEKSTSDN